MRWLKFYSRPMANSVEQEWAYLKGEEFGKLCAFFVIVGILPIGLDQRLLEPYQVGALGLCFLATAACGYGLSRLDLRLGIAGLIAGAMATMVLAMWWWSGPGATSLLLLPVALAVFTLGPRASAIISLIAVWLLWARPLGVLPSAMLSEAIAVSFTIGAVWTLGWIVESHRQVIFSQLFCYFQRAQRLLEEARDQRLALKQVNQDLAEAYLHLAKLNELVRASRLEAEAARQAKEQFVANVSHELRTPLNMIIGFTEMILNSPRTYGTPLPKALLSDIRIIHRNSQHLSQLINDVLDLSQIEAGQLSLSREWTDINAIVREAVEAVEPLYRAKGLNLEVDVPTALPQVYCDRLRIRQILLNLLSNAGRFTTAGGVKVTAYVDRSYLVLGVADTGPGIPREKQQKIFEPFQQLDASTRRQHGGSGLGLSISKRLVELHGGKMWLESEVGQGSTFYFSLPLNPMESEIPEAARWVNPYTAREWRTRARVAELPKPEPHILIMEREDVLRHQIHVYLGNAQVKSVSDFQELREEIASDPPQVVLINDRQVMENRGLMQSLVAFPERVPVVSCYIPGKREACERLNVIEYLVKPITREALLAVTHRVVPPEGCVLIVEDDQEMARLIARQLQSAREGYYILRATNGAQALKMMRERQPDAVFLDLGLPDQDGYEVLREKDADPAIRPIPVVIISARDPLGQPVVTSRLRVELAGGLSVRDVILCTAAISQTLSPFKRS
ncbi:MAG: ATP-binding protein [Anaerolineae bacterium]|nr:ATP-binding protein [Anaerolineae bacterium]MDW8098412.1 ATP-binding protein [Anaerolineae bacterium]